MNADSIDLHAMIMNVSYLRWYALGVCREYPDDVPDAWASSQKRKVECLLEAAEMLESLQSAIQDLRLCRKREEDYISQLKCFASFISDSDDRRSEDNCALKHLRRLPNAPPP
jgi:hypothetical protein